MLWLYSGYIGICIPNNGEPNGTEHEHEMDYAGFVKLMMKFLRATSLKLRYYF